MIIFRITSGLGNQMFQYAFYTLLKQKYKDTEVLCDTTWFHNNFEGREYELERIFGSVPGSLFNIKKAPLTKVIALSGVIPNVFDGKLGVLFDKFRRYPNRLLKNNLLKKRKPFIIDELLEESSDKESKSAEWDPLFDKVMNLDTTKDWVISGYFIEERYYSQVIDEVKKHLVFPGISEEWNVKYAEQIKNSNSVSIHVRRGDYLSDVYKDKFLTLGRSYYKKAVEYIDENIVPANGADAPTFFIFSDDEEFVKREFGWLENKVIVTGNSGDKSFRDMQLMSLCKHNITANSTFSQWGALLNQNKDHIVIYPKSYMVDSDNEIKIDKSWVRLESN